MRRVTEGQVIGAPCRLLGAVLTWCVLSSCVRSTIRDVRMADGEHACIEGLLVVVEEIEGFDAGYALPAIGNTLRQRHPDVSIRVLQSAVDDLAAPAISMALSTEPAEGILVVDWTGAVQDPNVESARLEFRVSLYEHAADGTLVEIWKLRGKSGRARSSLTRKQAKVISRLITKPLSRSGLLFPCANPAREGR